MRRTGIRGSFADMSLGYLLQWMGLSRQSGRIELHNAGLSCQLGFVRGRIIEALRRKAGGPIEASRRLEEMSEWLREPMNWVEGTFAFHPLEVKSGSTGLGIEVPALMMSLIPGEATPESAGLPPQGPDAAELQMQVTEALLRHEFDLPVLSETALRVQRMVRERRTSFKHLAEAVSSDPGLSGAVLRCANSASSGAAAPIDSLPLAVARLGFRTILSLSYAACLESRHITTPALKTIQHRLGSHSLGVALLSRQAARQARVDDEQAFLCGLMHDLGKVILLGLVEDLVANQTLRRPPRPEALEPLLHGLHTRVGRELPAQWKLPESVLYTLVFHHEPERAPKEASRLVAVVALADTLMARIEADAPLPEVAELAHGSAARILELEPRQVEALTQAAAPLFEQGRQLVG
jgi:HD-like signal output (HDOD) protein